MRPKQAAAALEAALMNRKEIGEHLDALVDSLDGIQGFTTTEKIFYLLALIVKAQ